jgi:hypothetical protein
LITIDQYFGKKPHTPSHTALAIDLLQRVEALKDEAVAAGAYERKTDADTGSEISGSKGGAGDGGFRLSNSTTGSGKSSHKEAKAVDCYDPNDRLDYWLDDYDDSNGGNTKLEEYGLYREHPDATPGWCHLTTRRPGSGRRTFYP